MADDVTVADDDVAVRIRDFEERDGRA